MKKLLILAVAIGFMGHASFAQTAATTAPAVKPVATVTVAKPAVTTPVTAVKTDVKKVEATATATAKTTATAVKADVKKVETKIEAAPKAVETEVKTEVAPKAEAKKCECPLCKLFHGKKHNK